MTIYRGENAIVKISGVTQTTASEVLTNSGDGFTFYATTAPTPWDPTAAHTVHRAGGLQVYGRDYTIDWMFGRVIMKQNSAGLGISFNGQALDLNTLAEAEGFNIECTRLTHGADRLQYGYEAKETGVLAVMCTVENIEAGLEDFNGAGRDFQDVLDGGDFVFIEANHDSSQNSVHRILGKVFNKMNPAQAKEITRSSIAVMGANTIFGNTCWGIGTPNAAP